jgi:hypothetical protein
MESARPQSEERGRRGGPRGQGGRTEPGGWPASIRFSMRPRPYGGATELHGRGTGCTAVDSGGFPLGAVLPAVETQECSANQRGEWTEGTREITVERSDLTMMSHENSCYGSSEDEVHLDLHEPYEDELYCRVVRTAPSLFIGRRTTALL